MDNPSTDYIDVILQVIANSVSTSIVLLIVAFLARNWIRKRIQSAIQHEYDVKLEKYKSELKNQNDIIIENLKSENMRIQNFQNHSVISMIDIMKITHEKKIDAIESVWNTIAALNVPEVINLYDVIGESSHSEFFDNPKVSRTREGLEALLLSDERLEMISDINKARPFIGEHVYSLSIALHRLVIKLGFMYHKMTRDEEVKWWEDSFAVSLIDKIFNEKELETLHVLPMYKFDYIRKKLETRIISAIDNTLKGKDVSDEVMDRIKGLIEVFEKEPLS